MLSTPIAGWSRIIIGEWSDRCSYVDDVPFLLLEGVEEALRTGNPVAAKFDAEGWEYLIVFDHSQTHIITETDDGYSLKTEEILLSDIARRLISDIRRDISQWAAWSVYEDMTPPQIRERKKDLETLCSIIEKMIAFDRS